MGQNGVRRIHWPEDEMPPDQVVIWRAGVGKPGWQRVYVALDTVPMTYPAPSVGAKPDLTNRGQA